MDVAKKIIVDTAKVAEIPLFAQRHRTISIDIDVGEMREKIQGFSRATLTTMTKRQDNTNVVDRCVEIVEETKCLDSTSGCVCLFAGVCYVKSQR